MISEDQNWNPRGCNFSFEQGELCKDLVHLYARQQGARHFQSKIAEMPKDREKYHYLLAEKILIISIKGRHCIHRDNISMKACTKVWGSAVQSTNQSLEWQWMGCNTYCDTAQESGGCPHQYFSVLISTSVSSSIHHCAPRRCLQVTHTQLRPPGAHTAVSTRNCWLLHCKLTCYSFPSISGQRNVFRNMLVYWGCQLHLSKYICCFEIKAKRGKTIHKKHWSNLSSDKCLTSALTEENLFCKTYRMCENFGLQKQLRPMLLLGLFNIMLETWFSLSLE